MKIFKEILYINASFLMGTTMIQQHQDEFVSMKLDRVTQEDSSSYECSWVDHLEYLAIFRRPQPFCAEDFGRAKGQSAGHGGTWPFRDGLNLLVVTLLVASHSDTRVG
ncbi:hypothetical protein, partial [Novipirellula sp.]|uniref:hypothetical protein n=1 Tax=Novipirellula sp. TaxID=2795430 RepID=UPI00356A34C7